MMNCYHTTKKSTTKYIIKCAATLTKLCMGGDNISVERKKESKLSIENIPKDDDEDE